jgi:Rieske Fe-S protein
MKVDRRDLLKVLCAGTGAMCAGVAACGTGDLVDKQELVKLPPVDGGRIRLALVDYPQLAEVGAGLVGEAQGMPTPLAIARESETQFYATRALCTHMTCTLRFNRLNMTLDCPCHGSSFEVDGRVINGPAVKPLAPLTTEFDGDVLGILLGS